MQRVAISLMCTTHTYFPIRKFSYYICAALCNTMTEIFWLCCKLCLQNRYPSLKMLSFIHTEYVHSSLYADGMNEVRIECVVWRYIGHLHFDDLILVGIFHLFGM